MSLLFAEIASTSRTRWSGQFLTAGQFYNVSDNPVADGLPSFACNPTRGPSPLDPLLPSTFPLVFRNRARKLDFESGIALSLFVRPKAAVFVLPQDRF